jgi:hypothetical protein
MLLRRRFFSTRPSELVINDSDGSSPTKVANACSAIAGPVAVLAFLFFEWERDTRVPGPGRAAGASFFPPRRFACPVWVKLLLSFTLEYF